MMMMSKQRRGQPPPSTTVQLLIDYTYILVGAAIVAIAFNLFLLPNKIASGGVSGISTIIAHMFGIEPAFTQWAFNIPLFILGIVLLGGFKYGLKTLVGTIFLPLVVFVTRDWSVGFADPLLGALFGGIGCWTWNWTCVPCECEYRWNGFSGANHSKVHRALAWSRGFHD